MPGTTATVCLAGLLVAMVVGGSGRAPGQARQVDLGQTRRAVLSLVNWTAGAVITGSQRAAENAFRTVVYDVDRAWYEGLQVGRDLQASPPRWARLP